MTRGQMLRVLATLKGVSPEVRRRMLARLPQAAVRAIEEEWWWQAHGGQIAPQACADGGDWRVWAIVAGRGFGKTRAGAEWVWQRARELPGARIALVAATLDEVAKVMVEGESGLLGLARSGEAPRWTSSRGILTFPSGATAFAYSAERPEALRGPQHHLGWCDELAKWPGKGARDGRSRGGAAWDNLMLGMRLGAAPRTLVTTTPQPGPLLERILRMERTAVTRGRTGDNPHLPEDFRAAMAEMYGGTRLGRQELDGVLFEEVAGALFTRDILEAARTPLGFSRDERFWQRIVVGVDPPVSADGDACGIVVCGLGADDVAYVLADCSVSGLRPEGWAARVAAAAEAWGASRVVAEKNQGGDMVESVLRAADARLPVALVSAARGKAARAEPVALRFEAGKARLAGCFPELEDELAGLTAGGAYEGPGGSPDRADAMVWAMSALLQPVARPGVRVL